MADIITHEHLKGLHIFDWALAGGPDYTKLAVQGAVVGGVLSLIMGRPEERGNLGHAFKYGAGGAAIAVAGITALFGLGKLISERSHEGVAEVAARGGFVGADVTHLPRKEYPGGMALTTTIVWPEGVSAPPQGWFGGDEITESDVDFDSNAGFDDEFAGYEPEYEPLEYND